MDLPAMARTRLRSISTPSRGDTPDGWHQPPPILPSAWRTIRRLRRGVTAALEVMRRDKVIGSSLEAAAGSLLSPIPAYRAAPGG